MKITFFGTPDFAVFVLNELRTGGIIPNLIVTKPDEPKGRKLALTPPPVKVWALKHNIPFIQPGNLSNLTIPDCDLFLVAAYGKIFPESIINTPRYGMINIHPSLLPKYRGPSPVQTAILNGDEETGVSLMLVDKEVDHGPIIAQEKISLNNWRPTTDELKEKLAIVVARLLLKVLPDWIDGKIKAVPQYHDLATFTKKFEGGDGLIDSKELLDENLPIERAKKIERMIRALNPDPGVFAFIDSRRGKIRVKLIKVKIQDDKLVIERVVPEGKREMGWEDFKRGNLPALS